MRRFPFSPRAVQRISRVAALGLGLAFAPAQAQEGLKPRAPERSAESEISRYCNALAPGASEARAASQLRRLADLEEAMREQAEKLENKEISAREWVTKRDAMMKAATDDVVAIYSKMSAEAAAPQLAAMDETVAAAVLSKLKPQVASAILGEMETEKAAKLTSLIAGGAVAEKS